MEKSVVKKVFTVIVGLSFGMSLYAQNFSISSFDETEDADALIAQVKDENEKLCAMIRIETTLDCNGFINFDAGQAYTRFACEKGFPVVYVSPGATRIAIVHKSIGSSLGTYSFPTGPLKPGTVYKMKISGKQTVIIEDANTSNYFIATLTDSKIEAAYIQVWDANGKPEGDKVYFENGFVRLTLPLGKYDYTVEAPEYRKFPGAVTITPEKTERADIDLKPAFGTLKIITKPDDADIFIDDKLQTSKSPLTLDRKESGTYTVRAEKAMYKPTNKSVTITDGQTTTETIELLPNFGSLVINTKPEGANIFIDGKLQPSKSPLTLDRIESGTYKIEAQEPRHKPTSKQVTITDGQTTRETIDLSPNFATVTLISEQDGTTIFVDEENKGIKEWTGQLLAGPHKIVVKKPSHRDGKKDIITVAEKDETITLPTLEPIYGKLDINITNISGAKVYIDGEEHSETAPCKIPKILVGEYKIKLVPNNAEYEAFEQTVEIKEEGKFTNMIATFREKEKFATLKITSTPPSFVSIDGGYIGKTPTTKDNLPLGEIKVSFRSDGYETLEKTINLQPGDNEIHGELEKVKTATLRITSTPPSFVSIDGKDIGKTPTTQDLSLGKKEVSFREDGYKNLVKTINLQSDDRATASKFP
ncbi:hypothetical protein AGMMS49965_22960 [Bacteroidia bacterium]|nr:hypothetical protein AGMMS49965_22960 [Bacteroidia bacterium]